MPGQTLRLSPSCYSTSVSALLCFQVGGTSAEKLCSDVDDIFWWEGSNVLKTPHNQGTGRSSNLPLQTKLLVQCGQGGFLSGAVPVLVVGFLEMTSVSCCCEVCGSQSCCETAVFQSREGIGVSHPTSCSPCRTLSTPSCCSVGKM